MRTERAAGAERVGGQRDLAELQSEALRIIAFGVGVLALLNVMTSGIWLPKVLWEPLPTVAGLLLSAAVIRWTLRYGPGAATWALALSLGATLSGLALLHHDGLIAVDFCLIVVAVTGLLGPRAGLGVTLLASGVVALLGQLGSSATSPVTLATLGLVWLAYPLAWMLTRPLRITLEWTWASHALAEEKTKEARASRAELVQVSKSLAEACERLESLNLQLEDLRRQAEQARQLKAEFAATVGHELRTPVNLIIGFAEMIVASQHAAYYDEPLPPSYRDDVQVIYRNACHISSLVDDILDLSQVDAHRMALHREWTSIVDVIQQAVGSVDALYVDAGLMIQVELPSDLPLVPVDPVRIRQVLVNLLYNAVRFTQRGAVRISARVSDAHLVVTVVDTGAGIALAELPRLFEEFRQFGPASGRRGGSGLGLAVCKRFVELHGGSIWAESAVGRGTTIAFSLPLHDNVATATLERVPSLRRASDASRDAIVVVDSGEESARILKRYLDDYRVLAVASPAEAARLTTDTVVRAVVLTSGSDQSAWEGCQERFPHLHDIPTVLCPLRTTQTVAEPLGVAEYLVKPVTRDQLLRALARIPHPRRVLIVEDDPEMRGLLARIVRSLPDGPLAIEAENGAVGLRLVQQDPPDVVLLDLLMPELDGRAFVDAVRRDPALCQLPVVVISAWGADERVLSPLLELRRYGGLTVGEVIAFLKADLDALVQLRAPTREPSHAEMASARPAASPS